MTIPPCPTAATRAMVPALVTPSRPAGRTTTTRCITSAGTHRSGWCVRLRGDPRERVGRGSVFPSAHNSSLLVPVGLFHLLLITLLLLLLLLPLLFNIHQPFSTSLPSVVPVPSSSSTKACPHSFCTYTTATEMSVQRKHFAGERSTRINASPFTSVFAPVYTILRKPF